MPHECKVLSVSLEHPILMLSQLSRPLMLLGSMLVKRCTCTHFLNKQRQRCKVWPQVISSPSPEIPMLNSRLSQRVQVIMHTSPAFWWTGSVVSNLPASIFRPLATFLLLRSIQHCNFPRQTSDGARRRGRLMWITPPSRCVMQGQKHKSNLDTNFFQHNPGVFNKCLHFPSSFSFNP